MKTLSLLFLVVLFSASAYADRSATRSLPALPEQISSITVPISVPVSTIQRALNRVAPKVLLSGSNCCQEWGAWGQGGEVKFRYRAKRRTTSVRTNNNKLTGSARIDAYALVYNRFVGILGKTDWGRVARVEIDGRAALSSNVQINKMWRLQVRGVNANVDIYDTDLDVLGILRIDLDAWVRGYKRRIERRAENVMESAFRDAVRNNDFVKRGATQAWNQACRSIRLSTDPALWLEIRPFAVRAAQPVIGRQVITVQVGVDAYTRIVSRRTTPECGRLPSEIILESPRRGQLNLLMPVMLDYDYLDELIKNEVDKHLQQDYLDFREFRTGPHGSSLLVEADVTVDTSSKATVCLLAKPADRRR